MRPFEDLDHRVGTGDEEVLVDQGIRHEFTHRRLRETGHGLSDSVLDHFIQWQQPVCQADQALEAGSVTLVANLFPEGIDPAGSAVLNDYRVRIQLASCSWGRI